VPHRTPPDDALRALALALLPYLRDELASAPAKRTYSQVDGERPAGVGRARYLRAWRVGHEAGDPECCADGRARTMSAAAWARHGASAPTTVTPPRDVAPVRDVDVLEELGLATRRTG
jgi:hypothetical protein